VFCSSLMSGRSRQTPIAGRLLLYLYCKYKSMEPELVTFNWDPAKALRNVQAHGVTFEEARTAFGDEDGILIFDPEHSQSEERFLLLGISSRLRLLVVVHCYRESETTIRLISARKASKHEEITYSRRWV